MLGIENNKELRVIMKEVIRIGIDSHEFLNWGGGIDFLATISEGLESTKSVQTFLLIDKPSVVEKNWIFVKCLYKGRLINTQKIYKKLKPSYKNIQTTFKKFSPNTKFVYYTKTKTKFWSNRDKKLADVAKKNTLDIVLPSISIEDISFPIPRIGYLFDFQHKYYPDLYSETDIKYRDKSFSEQIHKSKYIIVNSEAVKKDIEKFYPDNKSEVIVLPFKPFQIIDSNEKIDLSEYNLPEKYYIVSNQFWMHKSHITAFEALESVYSKGFRDIHIVCTGKMEDYRNPQYIDELINKVDAMKCKDNIHFLGFIDKVDQMQIMKHSIGLIQPTLFEGGPGGGATYNALCLGINCFLSDIPVNKEIIDEKNVYFFEAGNSDALARLMIEHRNDAVYTENEIKERIENNKKEYGQFLLNKIKVIIKDFKEDN